MPCRSSFPCPRRARLQRTRSSNFTVTRQQRLVFSLTTVSMCGISYWKFDGRWGGEESSPFQNLCRWPVDSFYPGQVLPRLDFHWRSFLVNKELAAGVASATSGSWPSQIYSDATQRGFSWRLQLSRCAGLKHLSHQLLNGAISSSLRCY